MVIGRLPSKLEQGLNGFVLQVRSLLEKDLKSIVLYGSAARGEFDTKRSLLDTLIVLDQVEYRQLGRLAPHVSKWRRHRIATPLVMSPEYIETSLDVYPIEILEMQAHRRVLYGMDVLAEVKPSKAAVRAQCEREARGKLLHLRQILLETALRPRKLRQAMILSVPSFLRIARYLLFLRGTGAPPQGRELMAALQESEHLGFTAIEKVRAMRGGEYDPERGDIPMLFEAYLAEVMTLVKHLDRLVVE
ncbi:MAG: nucleotidyltransferase domain-containing protein [Nitrospirae bacterium]|nr:nucleotidyltransferase domain-containing protein [Nitrospirota bacterium]